MTDALPCALVDDPRARLRNERARDPKGRCVVYWMQRAQRARDNPALDAAIDAANELGLPLAVFLGIVPFYPNANERHYAFLLDGVAELAREVEARGAAFVFRPYPEHRVVPFCEEVGAALVVGDENPLREPERWRSVAAERLSVPLVTVDADVVVPSSLLPKEEFAARTIRPKLRRELDRFLVPSREPRVRVRFKRKPASRPIEPERLLRELPLDRSARPVEGRRGGRAAGLRELSDFVERRLEGYPERRNRAEDALGTSRLSAFLHFGQLGPREIALAVRASSAPTLAKEAFLEQLIVRRELAVNFCARNPDYDSWAGMPAWARRTLDEHARDRREHLYEEATLERGETRDELWNAAQKEMVLTGYMHNYLRMYWAKKLLEWSATPARALEVAIRLNDRYELDGRDPNGYAGIAWAIAGKHDRPWPGREVYGTVRSMSRAGAERKLDVPGYVARVAAIEAS